MLRLRVNGETHSVAAHPMSRLLDVLREELRLTGTKEGCGEGECGACTVLIEGEPVCACLVPVAQATDVEITTIEAVGPDHPLQRAFTAHGGTQCGICTPGMILTALGLPPDAPLDEIRQRLAGNICRCTGYEAIYRSIRNA
jgi:aerobic carbon-monoxide dehydrogenase small subunit